VERRVLTEDKLPISLSQCRGGGTIHAVRARENTGASKLRTSQGEKWVKPKENAGKGATHPEKSREVYERG